eukprot:3671290-Rhodomonas_salina.1
MAPAPRALTTPGPEPDRHGVMLDDPVVACRGMSAVDSSEPSRLERARKAEREATPDSERMRAGVRNLELALMLARVLAASRVARELLVE